MPIARTAKLRRTFLPEQRALVRDLDERAAAIPSVQAPVLLLAGPEDRLVPLTPPAS
jgi:hypothetical protein